MVVVNVQYTQYSFCSQSVKRPKKMSQDSSAKKYKFGILTVSDSCFNDRSKEDTSGAKLQEAVSKFFNSTNIDRDIVPDVYQEITSKLTAWIRNKYDLILTTGGTGFSPKDLTPEATKTVIDRESPGLIYAMLSESLKITPMAMLSRAVAGIKEQTLIINLPGSTKGCLECFSFIQEALPHALSVLTDDLESIGKEHEIIQKIDEESKVMVFIHVICDIYYKFLGFNF